MKFMTTTLLDVATTAGFATIDNLWILIAAALVFFMQAGFKVLETGLVKQEHRSGVGVKNLMDWVAGSLAFFLIGFGFMFGTSGGGFIGTDLFFGLDFNDGYTYVFFLFQLAFAGTALTIVSGAMSGRTALLPYFAASVFTAIFVYPVFGHWAWGNLLITSNQPWLASMGFMDFAGSTVVHSVGAWVALVGIYMVGPRLGRFSAKGTIQPVKASDYSYSILGVMILWLGWWGFNGGSTLAFNEDVIKIILNTNLAAAAACFSAYMHVKFFQNNEDAIEKIIGGALTGLVAITACCNVVSTTDSIIIGVIAGVSHNYVIVFIAEKLKLDDPVGAIPVHGFGGVFGTLCVALFGDQDLLMLDRWSQLAVQIFGIVICFVFTASVATMVFILVKYMFGLRISPKEEMEGSVFADNSKTSADIDDVAESIVSQVSVRIGDRSYNLFSVKEYLTLSRDARMRLIHSNSVQYLDDYGKVVPPLQAVRYLAGVLEDQRDEAMIEKELVESIPQNDQSDILGSMQGVLMGEEYNIVSVFSDSFVLLRSKNKVSTDFYWHGKEKGYQFAVVGSCLDQNVPNAFLSALTISLLNEIVGLKKILPPEQILAYLDERLSKALENSNKKAASSGVELGVVVVNDYSNKAYYSGAGARIRLYSKATLGEVKSVRGLDIPLGIPTSQTKKFERVTIEFKEGDTLYLTTGGLSNQLNASGKRFASARLKEKIIDYSDQSMMQQKRMITHEFEEWKGKEPQTEDVLIIGIRL
jgi:ammonium transporter